MELSLANFLEKALVWPGPDGKGWVNLHWRPRNYKGITGSQAFKTLPDMVGVVRWILNNGGDIADLYYCTSLQAACGERKGESGRFAALRSAENAISSRLLFADVDKYPSKDDSYLSVKKFCVDSGSPGPSALVDSGRGVHAYWILPEPLERRAWLELAARFDGLMNQHGLKHDNISTDIARILRVPETLNYKDSPPRPVVLKMLNGSVDLEAWTSLRDATPTPALVRPSKGAAPIKDLFVDPEGVKKGVSSVFSGKVPATEHIEEGTLDSRPILQFCPMFKETLATGGQNVGQPVWHQQALACTFLSGGRDVFRDLGCKHADYSPESSDEMYNRKIRDRASKGLGFPSCAAFEADGAPQCKSCTLRGKVVSPLSIPKMTSSPPSSTAPKPTGKANLSLPLAPGQVYDDEGFICVVEGKGKTTTITRLFESVFLDAVPFIDEKTEGLGLCVECTGTGSRICNIAIPAKAFGDAWSVYKALNDGGCLVMGNPGEATKTLLTFRGRLSRESEASRMVAYGWEYEEKRKSGTHQGSPIGFAYDGTVYSPGRTRPTYGGDIQLNKTYCVNGTPDTWVTAVRMIMQMRSPGLEAVVLAAFAAPLMIFTGQPSTVVMVRGQSGGSKSTACAVACAAWARPRTAMMKPSASKLGIMRRMGRVRHLPTIWDDIRNEQFETVKDTLMEITQGGEGLKLDQQRDEREQGIWDNMLLTASNNSLVEYLEEISKNDGAALVRCFEFVVPAIHSRDAAYVDPQRLASVVAALDFNHGHAGREYAQLLGGDPQGHAARYKQTAERLAKRVAPYQPHERFWLAAFATLVMGGHLSNQLPVLATNGVQFDMDKVEEFLMETYLHLRFRHANANIHAETSAFVKHYLSQFFNTWAATKNETVWSLEAPMKIGKPTASAPVWPLGDEARRVKYVSVRWVISHQKLRIAKAPFDKFLRQEKVSIDRMKDGLARFYGAELTRGRMAGGLINVAAQAVEAIYEIDVKPGTWLDDILQVHALPDEKLG